MTHRSIAAIRPAGREDIADLQTRMALNDPTDTRFDPFLLLAHHGPQIYPANNGGLPFGPHPHRGFETVTFILDGALVHADSGGHQSLIGPGGVQWMTAGAGVVHSETAPAAFQRSGGPIEILQLWVNLPSSLKLTPPRYTGVQADAIPAVPIGKRGSALHLVSGEYAGIVGPIESLTNVFVASVDLKAGDTLDLPAPAGRTILCYVVRGAIVADGQPVDAGTIVSFNDGDSVGVAATSEALLLFGHADPIAEPVVARGPFVMTTVAEIDQANRDYRAGKFDGAPLSVELG